MKTMSDKVIVSCRSSGWRHGEWREWTDKYVGTILPNYPIDGEDVISLSTDLPENYRFPRRVIRKNEIIEIKRFDSNEIVNFTKVEEKTKTFQVKGSKGDTYTVKQEGSRFTCTCTGFGFRRTCKHITSVKCD